MELTEALARIVTDRTVRDRFLVDPAAWARAAGLAAPDAASLVALPPGPLVRYAESLLDKRAQELVASLPTTARLFPPLRALYRSWLARNPAPAVDDVLSPGLREAERALPALAGQIEPDWVAELFVYEVRSGCARRDGRRRRLRARWPHHTLVAAVEAGEIPFDPDEDPQEYTFP